MFEEVTKREGGKNAARRFGFVFGSTLFQVVLVAAVIAASAAIKAKVIDQPQVEVKFVKVAPPPPPAAPPPPAPPPAAKPDRKPPTNLPKPPPAQALVQPQEVKAEMKVDPNEAKEPQYDYSGSGEGVVGGVVGGVAPPPPAKPSGPAVEEAPVYASGGYKKPQPMEPGCVQHAAEGEIPGELMERLSGVVTVKFAINKDGTPSRFQAMTQGLPDRVASGLWRAVQACKWTPGADAQGHPTAIWVIMPFRFRTE